MLAFLRNSENTKQSPTFNEPKEPVEFHTKRLLFFLQGFILISDIFSYLSLILTCEHFGVQG